MHGGMPCKVALRLDEVSSYLLKQKRLTGIARSITEETIWFPSCII